MKEYLISDTHFGHKNVIKFDDRPFKDIDEHDNALIENWNKTVNKEDRVFHLGDISLCSPTRISKILEKLNGEIILIKGNHDGRGVLKLHSLPKNISGIHDYLEISRTFNDKMYKICFMHYPFETWRSHHIHFHGHSHGKLPHKNDRLDVGCNISYMNYTPISIEKAISIIEDNKSVYKQILNISL